MTINKDIRNNVENSTLGQSASIPAPDEPTREDLTSQFEKRGEIAKPEQPLKINVPDGYIRNPVRFKP